MIKALLIGLGLIAVFGAFVVWFEYVKFSDTLDYDCDDFDYDFDEDEDEEDWWL